MDGDELVRQVDEAFTAAGGDAMGWSDPHPDPARRTPEEEYSRVSDPGK